MDVQTRKWTRLEYERLVEIEILGPEDRVEALGPDDRVTPLAAPGASVIVSDLLP